MNLSQQLRNILAQLDTSQWQSRDELQTQQLLRFGSLAQQAWRHSPFFRLRFERAGLDIDQPWTLERYSRIPLLTRSELMLQAEHIYCHSIPPEHGSTNCVQTSGSTGQTVTVHRTGLSQLMWLALSMRDHLWHQRDFTSTLAIVKAQIPTLEDPQQAMRIGWGQPATLLYKTGPSYSQPISLDVRQQAAWLMRIQPHYLLTYPSNLSALLDLYESKEASLPSSLRQVRTIGETLHDGLRERCMDAGGIAIVDMYSSQELGLIALQCPVSGLYHTQDENLIVEVLNEQDQPCMTGEIGRVVVTDLTNYATPLIRYEIRDYAEVGPPCPCGRGLGTLKRIMGRRRNMVTLPDGSRHWPLVGAHKYREVADIRQYQVIQHSLSDLEVRLMTPERLDTAQEARLAQMVHAAIGHPFALRFSYSEREFPKTEGGKFEEFISLL